MFNCKVIGNIGIINFAIKQNVDIPANYEFIKVENISFEDQWFVIASANEGASRCFLANNSIFFNNAPYRTNNNIAYAQVISFVLWLFMI